jgi:hypothetical protein
MDTDEKIEALKAATREANIVLAELKQVLREFRELKAGLPGAVHVEFEKCCQAQIDKEMKIAARDIETSVGKAEANIRARLERLAALATNTSTQPTLAEVLTLDGVIRYLRKNSADFTGLLTAKMEKK